MPRLSVGSLSYRHVIPKSGWSTGFRGFRSHFSVSRADNWNYILIFGAFVTWIKFTWSTNKYLNWHVNILIWNHILVPINFFNLRRLTIVDECNEDLRLYLNYDHWDTRELKFRMLCQSIIIINIIFRQNHKVEVSIDKVYFDFAFVLNFLKNERLKIVICFWVHGPRNKRRCTVVITSSQLPSVYLIFKNGQRTCWPKALFVSCVSTIMIVQIIIVNSFC